MRVIGVIDLLGGRAVHARAGQRETYAPVQDVVGADLLPGDALALARAYVERFGVDALYVADLDAIMTAAPPHGMIARVAALGVPLWLDAGVTSADAAKRALSTGTHQVVVGLETLVSFEALTTIGGAIGWDRLAFSLDLRHGEPLTAHHVVPAATPAEDIARRAADAGARALIVLDLARVGMRSGPDVPLVQRVRARVPDVLLLAGGGVRGPVDLAQLAGAGCDGVLVASALHDGRLTADDVKAARRFSAAFRGRPRSGRSSPRLPSRWR